MVEGVKGGLVQNQVMQVFVGQKSQISKAKSQGQREIKEVRHKTIKGFLRVDEDHGGEFPP